MMNRRFEHLFGTKFRVVHVLGRVSVLLGLGAWAIGCIDLLPSAESLLPVGTPFVVQGTSIVIDNQGPCLVWVADNGVIYHLFQGPLLDNALFDQITTVDTTSRLVLVTRSDLVVTCEVGTIVEVREVLEIVE